MRLLRALVLWFLVALLALLTPAAALGAPWADGWETTPLAEEVGPTDHPRMSGDRIVWVQPVAPRGGELYLHELSTADTRALPQTGPDAREPEIDGDRIAYLGGTQVSVYDLSTGQIERLTNDALFHFGLSLHGDLVVWRQTARVGIEGPEPGGTSLLLHDLAKNQTTTLAAGGVGEYVAAPEWVVWNLYSREQLQVGRPQAVWAYSTKTGAKRELPSLKGAEAVALSGDLLVVLKRTPSQSKETQELWSYDLSSGEARVIDEGSPGYQSVQADGHMIAWGEYKDGSAWVALYDASSRKLTRIPARQHMVGELVLRNELLLWHGQALGRFAGTMWNYLFVYDRASGDITRLAPLFGGDNVATNGQEIVLTSANSWPYNWEAPLELLLFARGGSPAEAFRDVPGTHPYGTAIRAMKERGIAQGYQTQDGGSEFRPQEPLSRGQFAKMLALALGVPVIEGAVPPFDDVSAIAAFPGSYVAALAERGIITGTGPRRFSPYARLTRAQLMTLAVRGADRMLPAVLASKLPPQFGDYRGALGPFDATHGASLFRAEINGLVDGLLGYGSKWDPWQPATRGEAAQVLWNVLAKGGRPAPPV